MSQFPIIDAYLWAGLADVETSKFFRKRCLADAPS